MVHRVTTSDNEWQRVTTNDNKWYSAWQRMTKSGTTNYNEWPNNENEWKQMRAHKRRDLRDLKIIFLWKSSCFKWLLSFWYARCCSENKAASIRSLFLCDCCSEIHWKNVRWQKWMTANFNVRKINSTVERMDGCEYSMEIIIVFLEINNHFFLKWTYY